MGLLRIAGELSEEVPAADAVIEARLVGDQEQTSWHRGGGVESGKKVAGVPINEPRDVAQENVHQEATDDPIVMAYRPVKPDAKPEEAMKFESPVKSHTFASVMPVGDAQVAFKETKTGSVVEARLSCDHIELKHLGSGLRLRGDIGVLWGNEAGLVTERRAYLFNHSPRCKHHQRHSQRSRTASGRMGRVACRVRTSSL